MAVPFVSVDLFALATLATRADEAEGPPPTNFYALRDNLKPIIDIQLAVVDGDVPAAVQALRDLGYEHHGEGGVPGRKYLTRRPAGGPAFNVHVFAAGNSLLEDNRMIRNYLRAHPHAAREYERVKQRAIEQGHVDLLSYSHAKGAHVAGIREKAYAWTRQGGQ
jgi:GrpB-like predicted nucleotidyltransferase (UPF0157 family)